MIQVVAEITPPIKTLTKRKLTAQENLNDDATLGSLLSILADKYPIFKELSECERQGGNSELFVLINGKFPTDDLDTKLRHGDEVHMFHVATGG